MKLLKLIVKNLVAVFHLEIKRLVPKEVIKTFWNTKHLISVYDNETSRKVSIKEF
jgi:hypothetical protein